MSELSLLLTTHKSTPSPGGARRFKSADYAPPTPGASTRDMMAKFTDEKVHYGHQVGRVRDSGLLARNRGRDYVCVYTKLIRLLAA